MTVYPAQIDNNQTLPTAIDNQTPVMGVTVNQLRDAILSIEAALGVQPGGIYGSVGARLITIEGTIAHLQSIALAGDLGGSYTHPLVIGIQGHPVSSTPPVVGDVYAWNGIVWEPTNALENTVFIPGIDLGGNGLTGQFVIGLQQHPISAIAPTTGQVLQWTGVAWTPTTFSSAPSGPAGGDLAGTYPSPTIGQLQGRPLSIVNPLINQVLQYNGTAWVNNISTSGVTSFTGDVSAIVTGSSANVTVVSSGGFPLITTATSAGGDLTAHYPSPTIAKIQGVTVTATTPSPGNSLVYNGTAWVPQNISSFTAGTDLSGTNTNQTVVAIQNHAVASGAPTIGDALTWGGSNWASAAPGGDLSGTYTNATVAKIQHNAIQPGVPTDGYVLTWNNVAAQWQPEAITSGSVTLGGDVTGIVNNNHLSNIQGVPLVISILTGGNQLIYNGLDWVNSALNLAGGASFVTGLLPNTNQAAQNLTLTGDVTSSGGTTASAGTTVSKLQGQTLTVSSLQSGNQIIFNGTAWVNSALNLAGGSNFVTGTLPVGNLPSLAGDVTGTITANTVGRLQGAVVLSGTPSSGQVLTATSPTAASWATATSGLNQLTGDGTAGPGTGSQVLTVVKINGTSVPATPTANQVLVATSGTTSVWQQVDNAQVSNTAAIAVSKLASGTSAQLLLNNATPTPTWTTVSGDALLSSAGVLTVTGFRNIPLAVTAPTTGQVYQYNGSIWNPTTISSFTAGGDLSGTSTSQEVIGILNNPLPALADGYLFWSGSAFEWVPITGGGGGITQLTTDVLAGPGSGIQAATVVAINGTSVPATPTANQVLVATSGTSSTWQQIVNAQVSNTAAIAVSKLASGTAAQVLINNATPTPTWTTFSQDATVSATGAIDVTGLLTHTLPALTDGYLNWTGSAWALSSIGSTGIDQLTGDVLAGPGTGSQVATVVGLHSVPLVITSLATGNGLSYNGTDWVNSPLNLASGANYVTGVLPTGNQAFQTMLGDVTGTTNASTVVALQHNHVLLEALGAGQDGYVLTWDFTNNEWRSEQPHSGPPSGVAGGDLSAFYPDPTVAKIQNNPIAPGLPADGYVLTWDAIDGYWKPEAITSGSVTLGGDVTGPVSANHIAAIQGIPVVVSALTTGNGLYFNGSDWVNSALNLGGGSGSVTGVLPSGNQQPQIMSGDVTGLTSGNTVSDLQGQPVFIMPLTAAQDGYVLTFNFLAGLLEMEPPNSAPLNGDVIGNITSNMIAKLQGYPLDLGVLGAGQDGYVLTWNFGADKLDMESATGSTSTLAGDVTGLANDNFVGQRKSFLLMGA